MSDDISSSRPIPLTGDPSTDVALAAINDRFERGSRRMKDLEGAIAENTRLTASNGDQMRVNTEMTRELYEILMVAKSGINAIAKLGRGLAKFGSWVRTAVLWTAPPVAAGFAAYHAIKAWLHWE